jgi:preprotein translocase subunit SecD
MPDPRPIAVGPEQRFTEAHVGEGMAIVAGDSSVVLAAVNEPLPGEAIIRGGWRGFDAAEVADLIALLRWSRLEPVPELVRVGTVAAVR